MSEVQTVSIAVASASVVAGVIYYSLQIRHQSLQIQQQNKMRQTDLVVRLYSAFIGKEFTDASMRLLALEFKDYQDYVNKYGSAFHVGKYGLSVNDNPEIRSLLYVDNFFQQVGILLHRGFIDADLVREVFTYRVELLWRKAEPIIQGFRKEFNQPEAGKWFEYLYNEVKKSQQKGVSHG